MYDLLIRNIDIADGSGKALFRGSVAVKDGKIVKVSAGDISDDAAYTVTGKDGQILCPGFFDTHTHGDLQRIADPYISTQLLQGVTFDVCGNCGISAAPVSDETFTIMKRYSEPVIPFKGYDEEWKTWHTFGDYLASVKKRNPAIHTGAFVGHGTLRIAVMGMENRAPSAEELEKMKALLKEAMESGALGLSSGLIYAPGVFSQTDEMVELCKVVAAYNGIYATHMRNESFNVVESVKESIFVAKQAGCKLLISHHKVSGSKNHDLYKQTLKLIEEARQEGLNVICDQYQSNKGSTTLAALLPPFCQSEGTEGLLRQLSDPAQRAKIVKGMEEDATYENFLLDLGSDNILIISCQNTTEHNGKTLTEIAKDYGLSPAETVCQLQLDNAGNVLMAVCMCQQDVVDAIFSFPYTCMGSDGIGAGAGTLTHPRAVGNYVHMFEDYVRERKLVSWEEAIRKCTSLPADFIGLKEKGRIAEGCDADMVIFDRERIGTDASFTNQNAKPKGIEHVFVLGQEKVKHGEIVK